MGIQIKGKALQAIETYARNWDVDAAYEDGDAGQALRKLIRGAHDGWVTEADAHQIIRWVPRDELNLRNKIPWIERPDNDDKTAIAAAFVRYIESLPKKYELRVPLPRFPKWMAPGSVDLASDVKLVTAEPDAARDIEDFFADTGPKSRTYLSVTVEGYADHAASASGVTRASAAAKQTLYLLTHLRIADCVVPFIDAASTGRFESRGGVLRKSSAALNKFASGMMLDEFALRYMEPGKASLLDFKERMPNDDEERNSALTRRWIEVRENLNSRAHADFEYVGAAMEWFVEAEATENDAVAYVLTCIGIESLLGSDEQMVDMTRRLGDRYSFLTGKTRADRAIREERFQTLFRIRGKLVHARQRGLSPSETSALAELRHVLQECITHELRNLRADLKRRSP